MRAVARYTNSPREIHWKMAVAILEYVFFTSDFGIAFQRGSGLELVAYADPPYASNATDRRSVSRGAVMFARACVCWFSRTQKTQATVGGSPFGPFFSVASGNSRE